MMTAQEGISQDLDQILETAGPLEFVEWTNHNGVECRRYRMPDGSTAKLITVESDTAIESHRWVSE